MELRRKEGHLGLRITHKHRGLIALVSFLFIDFLLHQCLFSLYGWHGGRGELRRGNVDSTNNVVGGRQAGSGLPLALAGQLKRRRLGSRGTVL